MSTSDCVLLHGDAFCDRCLHPNETTAIATTSLGFTIEVTLSCPNLPLVPTMLFVSGSDELPHIVRAVEDLVLLRLPTVPEEDFATQDGRYDYFMYRPGGERGASLDLLPRPHTSFCDEDVGLLSRLDGHYTVAALHATSKCGVYELHRFDSMTRRWSIDSVPLVEPQASFPRKIPRNSSRLLYHMTSTVVSIGGTMGWVDLWRGILLCDVLSTEPKLRGVPMPLPTRFLGVELGCPKSLRGITFINKPGMEPYLRFVQLEPTATLIPPPEDSDDEEPDFPDWAVHDWTITTYSNHKMTTCWDDWKITSMIKASDTSISSSLNLKMLKSGLLLSSSAGGEEPERAFQNLFVSFPALGMDDNVVYLQARVRCMDPKVFVLALDMVHNKLLGAVEFATERICGAGVPYFPSNIGRYIDPVARSLCIPPVDDDNWEESIKYEGTESRDLPLVLDFPWEVIERP